MRLRGHPIAGQTDDAEPPVQRRRCGSGRDDPLLLYHGGIIALRGGDASTARERLEATLATDAGFSATGVAAARQALGEVAVAP